MPVNNTWDFLHLFDSTSGNTDFAFIILNQPILADPSLVQSLWSRATLRILVDGGANRWRTFLSENSLTNLKPPDWITGDFDSISKRTSIYFEERKVKFLPTPDQDETDFTKSLRHVRSIWEQQNLKVDCVLALCETCGRLDQIIANLETLHHAQNILGDTPLIEMSKDSVAWLLPSGSHKIVVTNKFIDESYWCGLIPLSGSTIATTTGLKWNLDKGKLGFGELVSTSNTFSETTVDVTCDKHLLWTMQCTSSEPEGSADE